MQDMPLKGSMYNWVIMIQCFCGALDSYVHNYVATFLTKGGNNGSGEGEYVVGYWCVCVCVCYVGVNEGMDVGVVRVRVWVGDNAVGVEEVHGIDLGDRWSALDPPPPHSPSFWGKNHPE